MTAIRLLYAKSRVLRGYEVSGHAGAGTQGNDLVCAAISFLATTCANALETVAGTKPDVEQSEGYLKVTLAEGPIPPKALVILDTFHQGARDLLEAYPGNIRLNTQAQ